MTKTYCDICKKEILSGGANTITMKSYYFITRWPLPDASYRVPIEKQWEICNEHYKEIAKFIDNLKEGK